MLEVLGGGNVNNCGSISFDKYVDFNVLIIP